MSRLDELEASLRTRWDRDVLAVYADELQAQGELRGELIAIDLRIEDVGPEPELVARRKELLGQWLATLPPGKVTHGFVDVDATGGSPVEQVQTAFASPAARYIRTALIAGSAKTVKEALRHIADAPRPGLVRLVVRQWDAGQHTSLNRNASADLFEALPDLDTLELDGYRILHDIAHPNVRRARISGSDAIASLLAGTPCQWSGLVELDFAIGSHIGGRVERSRMRFDVLPASAVPVLRRLDLSRNRPGFLDPDQLGGDIDITHVVDSLTIKRQVQIVMPGGELFDPSGK